MREVDDLVQLSAVGLPSSVSSPNSTVPDMALALPAQDTRPALRHAAGGTPCSVRNRRTK